MTNFLLLLSLSNHKNVYFVRPYSVSVIYDKSAYEQTHFLKQLLHHKRKIIAFAVGIE